MKLTQELEKEILQVYLDYWDAYVKGDTDKSISTGLGLSLSYDIVKAHGGEIKVNTKENEGTEFIIQLPVTTNT